MKTYRRFCAEGQENKPDDDDINEGEIYYIDVSDVAPDLERKTFAAIPVFTGLEVNELLKASASGKGFALDCCTDVSAYGHYQ